MDEFILALFGSGDKLKATTLYQLLTGKKTTSVLLFGYFHDLLPFFGLFPEANQGQFQSRLQQLATAGKLTALPDYYYCLKDEDFQVARPMKQTLANLDHFTFGKREAAAWRMVQFVVQVASMYQRTANFVPLETAPGYTEPVRLLIRQHQGNLRGILAKEFQVLFSELDQDVANVLARSFSGWEVMGQATYQLVPDWAQKKPWDTLVPISWHEAFFKVLDKHPNFVLYQLITPIFLGERNQSGLQTQALFEAGYTFEQVMGQRGLKSGTINDHVIEWALSDRNFPFDEFIHPEAAVRLAQRSGNPVSWRFRDVAELPVDFLSFALFQIRSKKKEERSCS